jgi:hypothetical protein
LFPQEEISRRLSKNVTTFLTKLMRFPIWDLIDEVDAGAEKARRGSVL